MTTHGANDPARRPRDAAGPDGGSTVVAVAAILVATAVLLGVGVLFIVGGDDDSGDNSPPDGNGGSLVVEDAWTTPSGSLAVVYLTIHNGTEPDRLVGVTTEMAGETFLMADVDMGAETVADGTSAVDLEIPPGATELQPGGDHLMLTDLDEPVRAGQQVPLQLTFENAGTVDLEADVLDQDAAADRSG